VRSADRSVGEYLATVLDGSPRPRDFAEPALDVRLASPSEFEVWIDSHLAATSVPASEAPGRALTFINGWLCFAPGPLLAVHAGVVARQGDAVLLVGDSGAGKSTLVAALTQRGWTYLSDEAAGLDEAAQVQPYARPINLRPGSWKEFPDLAGRLPAGSARFSRNEWHVPPSLLGKVGKTALPVRAVVFIRHDPDDATRLRSLGRGDALERMTLRASNLSYSAQEGMDRLAAVVRRAKPYDLVFADLPRALDVLETIA
jgi:hypothetical protein